MLSLALTALQVYLWNHTVQYCMLIPCAGRIARCDTLATAADSHHLWSYLGLPSLDGSLAFSWVSCLTTGVHESPLFPKCVTIQRRLISECTLRCRYIVLNQALVLSWWRIQRIEEDDYGGTQALMGEGLPPSIGLFLVISGFL
jgi:hypothetical protein